MYKRPRIIPTLLLDNGGLYKTKCFKNPIYLGDPINAIKIFNEKGVDELCVLDISASKRNSEPDYSLLEKIASESFMPLAYGGGVSSLEQCKKIFRLGYEKIIVNSAYFENPNFIEAASNMFGKQSIIVSIDYKSTIFGKRCFIKDGTVKINYSPEELAISAEKAGAGELLVYSIEKDGKRNGYDIETLRTISNSVDIPVIACGGANDINDISEVLYKTKVSAVAAGSMFVFFGKKNAVLINYPEEKLLYENGIYEE